ncbi:MAG TPA: NAD+ synthase [Rhodocyclaceae bacterium]|nr:NAD+ synthase [Rhodocyclaceae bacterium]HNH34540.1 NAD+ synthase [Rhodocyclaceae bacterium]
MKRVKIAVAQINCTVGDLTGNSRKIADAARRAGDSGADLLLTPELALCGYPPEDLLLRPDFYRACDVALGKLAGEIAIPTIVGHPREEGGRRRNAASLLRHGRVEATYSKGRLPNSEVFDEERYFDAGDGVCLVDVAGTRIGIAICEDVWQPGVAEDNRAAGAEVLLALNASPFHMFKQGDRHEVLRERVRATRMPVVYCNMVGGQDELVFDGASFVIDGEGRLTHQSPAFVEDLAFVEISGGRVLPGVVATHRPIEAEVYDALQLGVRDYLGKNGFPGAVLGLSGGVDSALTLCIAVDALGPDRVRAVMMPSPYTAQMSLDDSRALIAALGVRYDEVPIGPAMDTYSGMLAPLFADLPPTQWADTTPENIQARIRGMILMALSNRTGAIVLTTGNKSEMAVGYATLYGDMAGGFAVIKDVFKTFVYRLCRYRNGLSPVIPENILVRPPSAELKPDQTDQDTLPPYEILDAIIEAYMENDRSPKEIIAAGHREDDVRKVVGMLKRNEYKRRQAPVGIRVTRRGFGKDWRYPITSRYQDEF